MHALVIQYLDFAYREIWDRRNQLYFDRVHPVMLIIHQGRYFSRSAETSNPAYVALQYAMWALATCASTQFQYLRERLHAQARLVLEKMDCDEAYSASPCVEQAQAWLLVAHYELCSTDTSPPIPNRKRTGPHLRNRGGRSGGHTPWTTTSISAITGPWDFKKRR
jgi:hypothetical protein